MKRRAHYFLLAFASIVCAGWLLHAFLTPTLPRIPLRVGGEFRVYKVVYTSDPEDARDHVLGGSPKLLRFWSQLPPGLQRFVREPKHPYEASFPTVPAISIWWARIDPVTHRPELGPSGEVDLTLDNGKQIKLAYPDPADYHEDEDRDSGFRAIWIHDPPTDSKKLRLHVPVEDEAVDFEIPNPAYRK